MTKYIDKDKIEEILRNLWKKDDGHNPEHRICYNKALQEVQCEIDALEVKEADFPCDENWDKELALSLQIQAYLNTASDELYSKGKPLYSKSHLEGIHGCMKMWAKLHDYYFYKNACKNKEVDLEKEFDKCCENYIFDDFCDVYIAKRFFKLGFKVQKGE